MNDNESEYLQKLETTVYAKKQFHKLIVQLNENKNMITFEVDIAGSSIFIYVRKKGEKKRTFVFFAHGFVQAYSQLSKYYSMLKIATALNLLPY